MNGNGADVGAHLAARVAELEAAQAITARVLRDTWKPRLLALERRVDELLEVIAASSAAVRALRDEGRAQPRASERAQEDDDADDPH